MENNQNDTTSDQIPEAQEVTHSLPPKQMRALEAILSHPTLKEAALAAGISEPTLWRYRKDETFSRRLREAGQAATDQSAVRLQRKSSDAVTVLHSLMMKEEIPASARITAARAILDYSFHTIKMDELKAQLDSFEEFIKAKQEESLIDAAIKEGW